MPSKTMPWIMVVIILAIAGTAVMKIPTLRHFMVKGVWGVIDKLSNHAAKSAVLPEGVKVEADIAYALNRQGNNFLDVYSPAQVEELLPVIVYIHGGGFVSGDKSQVKQYCMNLAKEGYVVFNINYGLAPQHRYDAQIKDAMDALAWAKDNAKDYFGDGDRMFVAGDSAGAYLAAISACIHTNEHLAKQLGFSDSHTPIKLQGALLFCGLYDLNTGFATRFPSIKSDIEMFLGTTRVNQFKAIEELSIIRQMTNEFPPVFLSSGEVDPLHTETIGLIEALKENKIPYKALLFDKTEGKAMHGFQHKLELDISKQCLGEAVNFLKGVNNRE